MRAVASIAAFAMLAASLLAPSLPASAQAQRPDLPYPASATTQSVVQDWVNRYLPTRFYVAGGWSPNVVMLVSVSGPLKAEAYPMVTTQVFSETLTPQAAMAAGWRAAVQTVTFACDQDQYRIVLSHYYRRGDRTDAFTRDTGDGVWRKPDAGSTMDTVERAACFWGKRRYVGLQKQSGGEPTQQSPRKRVPLGSGTSAP